MIIQFLYTEKCVGLNTWVGTPPSYAGLPLVNNAV